MKKVNAIALVVGLTLPLTAGFALADTAASTTTTAPAANATATATTTTTAPAANATATTTTTAPAANATATTTTTASTAPKVDQVVIVDTIDLLPVNLASSIMEAEVYTSDNQKIGEVKDMILDDQNQVIALIVGVGGFLGIDQTDLAIPMADATLNYNGDTLTIATDLTEQNIRDAVNGQ